MLWLLGICMVMLTSPAFAMHAAQSPLAWVDAYRGAAGERCCGMEDCEQTTVAFLGEASPGMCAVMIGETTVTVPCGIVHPSETSTGVVCFRTAAPREIRSNTLRCVFYAGSM